MNGVKLRTNKRILRGRPFHELASVLPGFDERRLRALFSNDWKAIKKTQLEELLDYLDLDSLDELFEIARSTVWDPIRESGNYYLISQMEKAGQPFPRDRKALALVEGSIFARTEVKPTRDCPEEVEAVDDLLKHNCVILGMSNNIATEVAICRMVDAVPLDTDPMNRKKLRLAFARKQIPGLPESALVRPPEVLDDGRMMGGLLANGEWFLRDEVFEKEEFLRRRIPNGVDGGLLAVKRQQLNEKTVLTVVVAGLSAVGTYAGAEILAEADDSLFPRVDDEIALTFFRASYRKKARTLHREVTGKLILSVSYLGLADDGVLRARQ